MVVIEEKIAEAQRLLRSPSAANMAEANLRLECVASHLLALKAELDAGGSPEPGLRERLERVSSGMKRVTVLMNNAARLFSGLNGFEPDCGYAREGVLKGSQRRCRALAEL